MPTCTCCGITIVKKQKISKRKDTRVNECHDCRKLRRILAGPTESKKAIHVASPNPCRSCGFPYMLSDDIDDVKEYYIGECSNCRKIRLTASNKHPPIARAKSKPSTSSVSKDSRTTTDMISRRLGADNPPPTKTKSKVKAKSHVKKRVGIKSIDDRLTKLGCPPPCTFEMNWSGDGRQIWSMSSGGKRTILKPPTKLPPHRSR